MRDSIHPGTTVGPVQLTVADLDRTVAFYETRLGFHVRDRDGDAATLGAGRTDLLQLFERPDAPRPPRGATGLFHFAVLVSSRAALARALRRLVETGTPLQGASDHLVSESLYLADPEGNGIEIYRDRPRDEWRRDGDSIRIATLPLDIDGLLAEPGGRAEWTGLPAGSVVGHVHLRVADVSEAEAFYRDVLGFDLTARYGAAASFLSAGGYHHHIAVNQWQSAGGPTPPPGALGLRAFVVRLPDDAALEPVLARVRSAGAPVEETPQGTLVRDPSGNAVLLRAPSGS